MSRNDGEWVGDTRAESLEGSDNSTKTDIDEPDDDTHVDSNDDGDAVRSADSLMRTMYNELRRIAHARMARLPAGQTLQATEVVNEAYLKLKNNPALQWKNRNHFRAIAARAMYFVLGDHFKRNHAEVRGGKQMHVDITWSLPAAADPLGAEEFIWLRNKLEALHKESPEDAEIVVLRYFGGLTVAEIAAYKGVHKSTIERSWRFVRAWMRPD